VVAETQELGVPLGYESQNELVDKSLGYFRFILGVNFKASGDSKVSGTYTKEVSHHRTNKTLKGAVKKEIGEFEVEFEGRIKDINGEKIADAIRRRNKRDFITTFLGAQAIHTWAKKSFRGVKLSFNAGLDIDSQGTPLLFKGAGIWSPESLEPSLQCLLELELHVGLSKNGWLWVGRQIGKQAIVRFCQEAELRVTLNYLVSEGIVTVAASILAGIVGTLALSCLAEYVTRHAGEKGKLLAVNIGYRTGFMDALFRDLGPNPKAALLGFHGSHEEMIKYTELYNVGVRDAVENSHGALAKLDIKLDPNVYDDMDRARKFGILLDNYYRSQGRNAEAEIANNILKRLEQELR